MRAVNWRSNAIVGDAFRERIAERFALFECIQKAVDTSFANRECPESFPTTHTESVMLNNDVSIVQHIVPPQNVDFRCCGYRHYGELPDYFN